MSSAISKPEGQARAGSWSRQAIVLWLLRGVLIITIIAETISGDYLWAADALLALALCALPASFFRAHQGASSLDVEIVLLWMAIGNCTLGVGLNLYRLLPYYDKFLHVLNPVALAYCCVMFYWAVIGTDRGGIPAVPLVLFAAVTVLGASTIWEIVEFVSDQLARTSTQGSPVMAPLPDTMWDLILSLAGAVLGAVGGVLTLDRSSKVATAQTQHRGSPS